MPILKAVTLIEIDGEQFTKKYLGDMLPAIQSLARVYNEHGEHIDNSSAVIELQDPETDSSYSVWWNELEDLAAELPALLAD